jgi:hypothetical protein
VAPRGLPDQGERHPLVHPPPDHNSVCIRDLALQAFERDTWIACVLANPDGPDLERYLAATQDFRA